MSLPNQVTDAGPVDRNFRDLDDRLSKVEFSPSGTAFPPNPSDGQLYIYNADTTNGVKWQFQYRSAAASNKWEFIGGGWLSAKVATDETFTANGTWQDPTTAGPAITPALAGDYTIQWVADSYNAAVTVLVGIRVSGSDPSGPASDLSAEAIINAGAGTTIGNVSIATGVTATSSAIKMRYQAAGGTVHVRNRQLYVQPIRVAG